MSTLTLWMQEAGLVFLAALTLGAGVPALFAGGIRALSVGSTEDGRFAPRPAWATAAAYGLFLLVALCVVAGIEVVVASGLKMDISFQYGFPTLVSRG